MQSLGHRYACALIATLGIVFSVAAPALATPIVKSQASCKAVSGHSYCVEFDDTDPLGAIRDIAFKAPSSGIAIVTMHGVMVCNSNSLNLVVDLTSGIATNSATTVTADMPSGARYAVAFGLTGTWEESFNLASTFVFAFTAAGKQNFYFIMNRQRMDSGTHCVIYNPTLTVEFMPSSDKGRIITQSSCTSPSGYCRSIFPSDPITPIRQMVFAAPSKGTAVVTFNGTLYCANSGTVPATVDIDSEIVPVDGVTANSANAGGLRHAARFMNDATTRTSRSFNLYSTRVFPVTAAGNQNYFFNLQRRTMDPHTSCFVYSATFTVRFFHAGAAPEVTSQDSCHAINGSCGVLGAAAMVMRSISIKPEHAGTAIVTFHGSATCKADGTGAGLQILQTQIQTSPDGSIIVDGESGLEQDVFIDENSMTSVNFASTFVQKVKANNKKYKFYMKLGATDHPYDITCRLYNAAFTVKVE